MAISKIVYKASASATPETWMDATTATAAAADIIAPKTAMLADGVVTTGTMNSYTLEDICPVGFPSVTGDVVFNGTRVRPALFKGNTSITSFVGSNVTSLSDSGYGTGAEVRTFNGCTNLTSVSFPLITSLDRSDYLFSGCTKLETVNFDWKNLTALGTKVFENCPAILKETYVLPKVTSNVWTSFLTNNTHVIAFDIGSATITLGNVSIYATAFSGDSNLSILILRNINKVRALSNISAFNGTPFASGGSGGILYVPADLVASYESATNWSTILAYTNNQIKSIESTHTDPNAPIDLTVYYVDETPISS